MDLVLVADSSVDGDGLEAIVLPGATVWDVRPTVPTFLDIGADRFYETVEMLTGCGIWVCQQRLLQLTRQTLHRKVLCRLLGPSY